MKTESGHSWTLSRSRSLTVSIWSLAGCCDDSVSLSATGGFDNLSSLNPSGGAACVTTSIVRDVVSWKQWGRVLTMPPGERQA